MTIKKIYTLVAVFLFAINGVAQTLDTATILKNLKIRLLSELDLGLLSGYALEDYLMRDLKVTIIKSKGFENLIFFKINSQVLAIDNIKEKNKTLTYSTPVCLKNGDECYFVYAFNTTNNSFYRLKGTRENDFVYLYNSLQNKWIYWSPIKKIKKATISQFTKDYSINELDLACLLLSLKSKSGNCLEYFSRELEIH